MTIGTTGTLDVEKGTSGPGATLDGVKVTDNNTSTATQGIKVGTSSAATLLVDDGTAISGLARTDDRRHRHAGCRAGHRQRPGATLDGVKVTDKNAGAGNAGINIGTGAARRRCWLTTAPRSAAARMTIGATGTLDVEKGTQRPRRDARRRQGHGQERQRRHAGINDRHRSSAATLLLDDGTAIGGGTHDDRQPTARWTSRRAQRPRRDARRRQGHGRATPARQRPASRSAPSSTATLLVDDGTVISGAAPAR